MTDPNHIAEARKKVSRPQIREICLRNGARIEPGRDDLPDYVYESVFELLEMTAPAVHGEPVDYPPTAECEELRKDAVPDEEVAKMFHESYEELAPSFGYETRKETRKDWEEVPPNNKELMVAVIKQIRLALQAECEKLRKDAERWHLYRQGFLDPEALDSSVDAAMAAKDRP